MIVKTLMNSAIEATTTGTAVTLEMPKSNRGLVMAKSAGPSGLSSLSVTIEGRLSDDMDWVTITNGTITMGTSAVTKAVEDIQLYPQMRAKATMSGTSTTMTIQLGC